MASRRHVAAASLQPEGSWASEQRSVGESVHRGCVSSLKIKLARLLSTIMPLFLTLCKMEIRLEPLFKDCGGVWLVSLADQWVENYRTSEPTEHLIFQKQEPKNNSFRAGCANTRNIAKQYPCILYVGCEGTIILVAMSRQKYEKLVKIICHIKLFENLMLSSLEIHGI